MRTIASQTACVLLASTMGIGAVFLIAFLTEFESQGEILLQVILAVVLIVVGFGGVRSFARRTPSADAVDMATGGLPA